jgi:hypothetical protein
VDIALELSVLDASIAADVETFNLSSHLQGKGTKLGEIPNGKLPKNA